MNEQKMSWWIKLLIAVLSAIAGAIGGGAAMACGIVTI
jgi:hypothetical protein